MDFDLTLYQTRVLGSLIEKEITTPDQYPLSLNALTSACNQKSNREPVLELDEATVQQTVDELIRKHLIMEQSGFGSRVVKYKQRLCKTEFAELQLNEQEIGILCTLLLRGPQTPGELRTRAQRLCALRDVQEVEATLQRLIERPEGALVVKLPREPGKRESRYAHLLSGEVALPESGEQGGVALESANADPDQLALLMSQVATLQAEIADLKQRLARLEQTQS